MRTREKFQISPELKEMLMRAFLFAVIIAVGFLAIDTFTREKDERRQVIDQDGGSETALIQILSDIKGAGDVDVLVRYDEEQKVSGVIVTASGAGNIVVRNNLTGAVAAVFDIPVSNVMVFEKENGGASDDK